MVVVDCTSAAVAGLLRLSSSFLLTLETQTPTPICGIVNVEVPSVFSAFPVINRSPPVAASYT